MKEIKNSFIKEYEYGDYRIYVQETTNEYEFYLQHKDYGIISLIIGFSKEHVTLENATKYIEDNLEQEISFYHEEYED